MAHKSRVKMDVAERAKQFMPFAALKGLPEALAEREKIVVPITELSEDMAAELDRKMHQIKRGGMLTVVYYQEGAYTTVTGQVIGIDASSRILKIEDKRIPFHDILDVEVLC